MIKTVILLIPLATVLMAVRTKHVSMNLKAKWNNTPLLLEASEYLAEESNDKFWSFINTVAELHPDSYINDHDEANYHMIMKYSSDHLSPLQMNLLKFALSLRAYSARVQMFNQMANDKKPLEMTCDAFVDINGILTCDVTTFEEQLNSITETVSKSLVIKSDHHYPGSVGGRVTVILYAEAGTHSFATWHSRLRPLAERGDVDYILRHFLQNTEEDKVALSGYGVELAIKSQEYKAKDDTKVEGEGGEDDDDDDDDEDTQGFMFSTLRKIYPDLSENLAEYKQHLLDSTNEMPELKPWQFQDLSYQAAQRVISADEDEQLAVLKEISQNFPVQTRFLVKTSVKEEMRKEIQKNQKTWESTFGVYPGESALFINGLQADMDVYDVFTLLETMKSEAKLMEGLNNMGILGENASNMLKVDLKDGEANYALDMRDESIVWVNDLTKDRRYQGWPRSVTEMLRPTFPGMLRHVRQNFFNVLFIVDPADLKTKELIQMAEAFYVHDTPFRIGLSFVSGSDVASDVSVALTRAFYYLCEKQRPAKALEFITDVYDKSAGDGITVDKIFKVLNEVPPYMNREELLGDSGQKYDFQSQAAQEYFEKTGLGSLPQVLLNGVPLKQSDLDPDNFEDTVVTSVMQQTPNIQKAVYHGRLIDGMDVLDFLMDEDNVMPRLNSRILETSKNYLDISKSMSGGALEQEALLERMSAAEMSGVMADSLRYIAKKEEAAVRSLSNWIVADVDTVEGRALVYDAIKQLKSSNSARLAIVHNPTNKQTNDSSEHVIAKAVQVAMETLPPGQAKMFVTKLVKEEFVTELENGEKTLDDLAVSNMDIDAYKESLSKKSMRFLQGHAVFCSKVLHFKPGQRGIVSNGKVIGPLNDGEKFTQDDFNLLEQYTLKSSATKIEKKVKKMDLEADSSSDLIMRVASLLLSTPQDEARKDVTSHGQKHSVIQIPPREASKPAYDVVAILDPATRAAQKYTSLIMVLQEVANVNIKVFMNCKEKLSEAPLKSFYRYVLEPRVSFDVGSHLSSGPQALFTNLPHKPILTLAVDAPESWLVESVRTQYDLDNIHLEEIDGSINAEFELEYLLLEGHCFDAATGQPPRGLEFTLGTPQRPAMVDTIVMANLGYFQLKAKPGAWDLKLRRGRSEDLYEITGHDFTDSPSDSEDIVVVMDTFKSKIIKVKVSKQKGKEDEDLLGDIRMPEAGIWDSISSTLTGGKKPNGATGEEEDTTINIFTLASGHLYERFVRIMILSVLKNTQSKVKFWFLKNYLSPTFKDFIPHMAKEYNFEYELIQYKWPRWLHQQTEKQRIMWGYKILFLDVLFPLSVNKIIFVDADQIVRANLQELVDFDLEGAPYGYTPFCDSRKEMDGFRFWKSGYWSGHLAGRRYHISALYVVDLKKFRKIAAGDRLRGQYQGLSQDPNSLSNLDQDLPNNMIHQVPIKSLPQEWLWCETWCSDHEKSSAKTIDLCNNPLTKEPKLTAAQRIVPEWTSYDDEVKLLWDKIYKSTPIKNTSQSHTPVDNTDTDKHQEL